MENKLHVKSLGVKAEKRQTSRLDKIRVFSKTKKKNNVVTSVRKDSSVDNKKKNGNTLVQNTTNDTKKSVLLTPSTIKKTNFINDVDLSSKEKTTFSDIEKKKEYHSKDKTYEKKYNVDNVSKLKKNDNAPIVNLPDRKKKNDTKLRPVDVKQTEIISNKQYSNLNEKNTCFDKNDKFLKTLLKKEHISVQTQLSEESSRTKNDAYVEDNETEETSEEDIFNLDLIEQYKKKKQKETEKRKKEKLAKRKEQLIKQVVLKDAETQMTLDDFTIFYENAKPHVDKIVEDILHKALKEIVEENELNKIREKIDTYENTRIKKFESIKIQEEKNQNFYNTVQQKIKERTEIKKRVKTIIEKRIANTKARKTLQYIFQKNIDSYSEEKESLLKNFQESATMFVFPWISEFIQYLMKINTDITNCAVNEIIEKTIVRESNEKCNQMKKRLLKEREKRNNSIFF